MVKSGPPPPLMSARTTMPGCGGCHSLSAALAPAGVSSATSASLKSASLSEVTNTAAFSGGMRIVVPEASGCPRATATRNGAAAPGTDCVRHSGDRRAAPSSRRGVAGGRMRTAVRRVGCSAGRLLSLSPETIHKVSPSEEKARSRTSGSF